MTKVRMNFGLTKGGMGDNVARLPALVKLLKAYPHVYPYIYVPDFFLEVAQCALKPYDCMVKTYTSFVPDSPDGRLPAKDTDGGTHTTLHTHLTDMAFRTLLDEDPRTPSDRNYVQLDMSETDISSFNLPEKYVVLTTGITSKTREWPATEINKTAKWCVDQGLTPVFLGSRQAGEGSTKQTKYIIIGHFSPDVDYSVGVDLVDKTTLMQAAKVMAGAVAVLGVDNGLIHLAACSQVPIIVGYTMVEPATRLPIRNDVMGWGCYQVLPEENLACRFCQYHTNFKLEHDYRTCMYNTFDCCKQMTAEKFIGHLETILAIK